MVNMNFFFFFLCVCFYLLFKILFYPQSFLELNSKDRQFRLKLNQTPLYNYFIFTIGVLLLTFLTFTHYLNFSIIINQCINSDQHSGLWHEESWTSYLPSYLVLAKIPCSRCPPCTKEEWDTFIV